MSKLVAVYPILLGAHQYEVGDTLPEDSSMAETWLASGAAVRKEDTETAAAAPKARLVTAEPGEFGKSEDGDPDALVGKLPKSPQREKPAPRKRRTKK